MYFDLNSRGNLSENHPAPRLPLPPKRNNSFPKLADARAS